MNEDTLNYLNHKIKSNHKIKLISEGIDVPDELPEIKQINVNGREEHEAYLRDPEKMLSLGLDQYFEIITYLNRWGSWLNGSKSFSGEL